jgi:hypothetical protein
MTKYVWDGAVWKQVFDGGYFIQAADGTKQVDYAWVWVDDSWRLYYTRAAAVTLTATPNSWEQITLNWNSVAVGATYVLKRDGAPIYSGPALTHPDTLLLPSQPYTYTIESYLSGTISTTATANATTLAYGDLGLVATVTKYNNINLSWSAANGSVNRFHLYDGATPIYNDVGTSMNHAVGASTGHNYTLHAMRTDTSIATDTTSASTGAVPIVYAWAHGTANPNDADFGWKATSVKVVAGENVNLVGSENHLIHVTFRAASYGSTTNQKGRFAAWVGAAYFGNEHIKGLPYPAWNDFAGNPDHCVLGGGVHGTQLRLGGIGETIDSGCHPNNPQEGTAISDWGSGWWAASHGNTASVNVCTYGVYYWYYAYRSNFDDMIERFDWMTAELADRLADRNLHMFTWSEPTEDAPIVKVQIGDPETEELIVDWEAPGYVRGHLEQPMWAEWLQLRREGKSNELRGNASGVRRPGN